MKSEDGGPRPPAARGDDRDAHPRAKRAASPTRDLLERSHTERLRRRKLIAAMTFPVKH